MSFSLNEKLREEIIKTVSQVDCRKLEKLVEEINEFVNQIEPILEVDVVEEFISLPLDAVKRARKCLSNQYLGVDLTIWVYLDGNNEHDEELLCRESLSSADIGGLYDTDMIIELDSVEKLKTLIKKLIDWNGTIYWTPSEYKIVRSIDHLFEKTKDYEYEVKLGRDKIQDIIASIWYSGEKRYGKIRIVFNADIYSKILRNIGRNMDKIIGVIEDVGRRYSLPVKVSVIVKPIC